ncbi:hypothetical protein DZC78_10000 [Olleya aquimaris]|uniref:Lipoprotein n=1 Tax=Olleya sediminilitoris TaxID=2795739 RepID=A0ABS1WH45_9FLAO|nr:hypothetical protein [Olleya sediminilitoris]AXO80701.1 hypothetical protein DZC78_10000 [Olleya aquimaris]MBL7558439.1 hypothetical protein [Olleya sediminilitoris]
MKKLLVLSVASLFLTTSCGTMGVVSTPSDYKTAGKEVSVVKKGVNIFGLTPMDVQKESGNALSELNGKCSNGVTNIRTTVSGKAFIVGFEKLEISGNCN